MLDVSYEIWGIGVTVLLIGFWTIKRCISRKSPQTTGGLDRAIVDGTCPDHDIHHQALMFLMAQKTDSVLAALARTIQQERQKLGGVVRKPSMNDAVDAFHAEAMPVSTGGHSSYDQILPMAREGLAVATIARQLQLPEAEISMVMRLSAS